MPSNSSKGNTQAEPAIIVDGVDSGRTIRAFEPISNGQHARKGLTFTGIIYDGDRLRLYSEMLPVVADLSENEIVVDVFHDFDLTEEDKWYSNMGVLQWVLL
jgi:hypothetical protein